MINSIDPLVTKQRSHGVFWWLQLGGWGLFTFFNLLVRQYFSHYHISELINSVLTGLALLIATSLLRLYYQKYLSFKNTFISIVQLILGSTAAATFAMGLFAAVIYPNQQAIFSQQSPNFWQQILFSLPTLIFLVIVWSSIYASVKKQRLLKAAKVHEQELHSSLREAKLEVLLSQINPHFIFNAINNIRALILEDSDKARDMLASLSEVMRYTMQVDRDSLITLEAELAVLEQYVALNKLQFERKLQVEYDIDKQTLSLYLPSMVLQLLVENAIKHGIGKLRQGGLVTIKSYLKQENLIICVENSGELLIPSDDSTGVGIKNIQQRLLLEYGSRAKFSLEASDKGVLAQISLPSTHAKDTTLL